LDPPVRPLEEDLGDQVIRGRVPVIPNEPVGDLALTSPVDIEDPERNAETLRQPSAVPDR